MTKAKHKGKHYARAQTKMQHEESHRKQRQKTPSSINTYPSKGEPQKAGLNRNLRDTGTAQFFLFP